ncbi:hypothetical protein A2533_03205 [Candidatus Falkowbacteria bacterium RIFOXYD2_FULL_35_9]|uniref:Lipoprotein n=1 Tax=Candidatus Falkowbacteria bacterium RIFOXYC2_FULL_36_12 TaxID=1798002 RepID=A0A1F5SWH0_9BACT|nr:MAG: hypothetical protein A2300_00675 [Candidatus Falkowbacteria bacterium RIFOXYB2_FULL_35_7]OGF30856.1 MAG: hypothetical protein A2478_00170 [Candidatus Falkowbacteria bacterium RIFOXYC2_FULL_36_12]OGF33937.1 MAG: hypothetical protein A2223_04525 [Candidatus Falkowbacteria bacterium RIFOXYA2_FULL_35_8]OGF48215.1 MAG: hypothetical protein A2533_03205 [Candidatus Falkowbacteria bacterium RIFOXYD2_FULL_35_9]
MKLPQPEGDTTMRPIRLLLSLMIAFLFGCQSDLTKIITQTEGLQKIEQTQGIILYGFCSFRTFDRGILLNTNDYPLKIRQVEQTAYGEITASMKFLPSKSILQLSISPHQIAVYIYTINGALISFIACKCPKK